MENSEKNDIPVNEIDAETLKDLGLPETASEEEIQKATQRRIDDLMGKD